MVLDNLDKFIDNNKKVLARIGFFALVLILIFLVFVLPIILNVWTYQVDPLNLIFSTILTIATVFLAFKANEISKNSIEQNRPCLSISTNSMIVNDDDNGCKFEIVNEGNFEAYNVNIFYKMKGSNVKIINKLNNNYISPKNSVNIELDDTSATSVVILYQNMLTLKVYIYGAVVNCSKKTTSSFNDTTDISDSNFQDLVSQTYQQNRDLAALVKTASNL